MEPNPLLLVESPPSHTDLPPSPKDLLIASYDVLILIFKLFIPTVAAADVPENQLARVGQKQLLNLALTCKSFVDPALECLWSHLESLDPLFGLHPGFENVDGSYFFRGDIDARSSSRYHEYARKVRTVSFRDGPAASCRYRIAFAGYTWLGQQLRGAPLLPGLRSIHFAECPKDSLHLGLLPLMLSPSVERVEFGNSFLSTPAFHTYALHLVCDGLPSLTELVLCDAGSSSQISHIWGTLAGLSARLQSLTLRFPSTFVLGTATLRTLAQELKNLTSLFLDVHTESHRQSKDTQDQVLPSLHTLHLVNRSETKLCDCYPSFLLDKATSITFSLTGTVTDNDAFSESLDTLSTLESLRRVEIEGYSDRYITVASVIPFLKRLRLEELYLQKIWAFRQERDERSAHNIVKALVNEIWSRRRLRCLSLPIWRSRAYSNDSIKYYPLSCLLYAAIYANGLQHMSLSIDSTAQGPKSETVTSMIKNWTNPGIPSELRYLEIAEMRDTQKNFTPNEYRDIARFLDLIFPNLISVTMIKHPQVSTRWDEHWQLIEEYRQMQKSLRLYQGSRR